MGRSSACGVVCSFRWSLPAKVLKSSDSDALSGWFSRRRAFGMMMRYSFHLPAEAECVEAAVASVLDAGHRTRDLAKAGLPAISTAEMGGEIVAAIKERVAIEKKEPVKFTA